MYIVPMYILGIVPQAVVPHHRELPLPSLTAPLLKRLMQLHRPMQHLIVKGTTELSLDKNWEWQRSKYESAAVGREDVRALWFDGHPNAEVLVGLAFLRVHEIQQPWQEVGV
jgi:hypothetical protein